MKRFAWAALAICAFPASAANPPLALPAALPLEVAALPAYLVVDQASGLALEGRNAGLRFVPASVTKVMTAYVAFELIAAGKLSPDRRLTVSPATAAHWSGKGTSMALRSGETVSVDALLHGIATASANDAAVVLAEGHAGSVRAWTALMNAEARRLGLADSHFATPNGWPDGGATYVSASDLVKLADALIARHPELYRRYFGRRQTDWNGRVLTSHDPVSGIVPGADGIKTGFTREAGYNFLGSAIRDGRRVFVVVAGAGSEAQRAAAARALIDWAYAAWDRRLLFGRGAEVGSARVQGGDSRQVALVASRDIGLALPRGSASLGVALHIRYSGPLIAPIAKGAPVAELEIRVGSRTSRLPLAAARAIGEAGPLDRLWNGIAGLLT